VPLKMCSANARANAGLARARDTIPRNGHFISKAGKKRNRLECARPVTTSSSRMVSIGASSRGSMSLAPVVNRISSRLRNLSTHVAE